MKNVMIDNNETTLNDNSSFVINVLGWHWKHRGSFKGMPDKSHYFVPELLVYHFVAQIMKLDKAFKDDIE